MLHSSLRPKQQQSIFSSLYNSINLASPNNHTTHNSNYLPTHSHSHSAYHSPHYSHPSAFSGVKEAPSQYEALPKPLILQIVLTLLLCIFLVFFLIFSIPSVDAYIYATPTPLAIQPSPSHILPHHTSITLSLTQPPSVDASPRSSSTPHSNASHTEMLYVLFLSIAFLYCLILFWHSLSSKPQAHYKWSRRKPAAHGKETTKPSSSPPPSPSTPSAPSNTSWSPASVLPVKSWPSTLVQ